MKTYATLGPACCRADLLTELLDMGLTGFRLNLSDRKSTRLNSSHSASSRMPSSA